VCVCEKESERQTSCFFICCFKQTSLALAIQLKSNSVAGRSNKNKIEKIKFEFKFEFEFQFDSFCVLCFRKQKIVACHRCWKRSALS
jgi:hypothetical protein